MTSAEQQSRLAKATNIKKMLVETGASCSLAASGRED